MLMTMFLCLKLTCFDVVAEVEEPTPIADVIFNNEPYNMFDVVKTTQIKEQYVFDLLERVIVIEEPVVEEYPLSQDDIELIALVTIAEAEGECDEGKRLVVDTILNRMDSGKYPSTAAGVIYQPHQFSSMWNGRSDRCSINENIIDLVKEELLDRTNYDVIYFTAGEFGQYGTPLFSIENHYFSSF